MILYISDFKNKFQERKRKGENVIDMQKSINLIIKKKQNNIVYYIDKTCTSLKFIYCYHSFPITYVFDRSRINLQQFLNKTY